MPRLFSALVPPAPALDHLVAWLAEHPCDAPVRWSPPERWHITLGFFGDGDDPDRRSKWLRRRAEGRLAPTFRLAGAQTFPGTLWAGVRTRTDDDAHRFDRLAQAAGAGRQDDQHRTFRPHLTLARWRGDGVDRDALIALFAGYTGPWCTPTEVLLMRSDFDAGVHTYTTVQSLPLARA